MTHTISLTVNGKAHCSVVEPRLLLVHYLRDILGLTGTNIGCDTSQCGSCTVHMDGEAVKACTVLAVQADGASIQRADISQPHRKKRRRTARDEVVEKEDHAVFEKRQNPANCST